MLWVRGQMAPRKSMQKAPRTAPHVVWIPRAVLTVMDHETAARLWQQSSCASRQNAERVDEVACGVNTIELNSVCSRHQTPRQPAVFPMETMLVGNLVPEAVTTHSILMV